ncbi:hypothetical protein AX15_004392 [Amanita polypyramis BW_CC]|nr:hypothetical protein AX15_004392 [Amanita polypyramis BW_CC]
MDKEKEVRAAEATYTKATQAELAKNYDAAFRLYIKAAEGYLHLSRLSGTAGEAQKTKWKASATRALERAEKIKSFTEKQRTGGTASVAGRGDNAPLGIGVEVRLTPVGINYFSPQEQLLVLRKGAKINGQMYPPWEEPVFQPLMPSADSNGYHGMDDQPPLSSEQLRQSPEWRRPTDSVIAAARQVCPEEILQNIVTDCSLCASITVSLEHDRRFESHLLPETIHLCPEHLALAQPCGRYYVRILFNGTWRRVFIDDRLPHRVTDSTLLCMSMLPPRDDAGSDARHIVWPSLLEKAYMKLMGGYEFPGSISSSDLHALAGWIPEHIDIKSPNFVREKTWTRLLRGFLSGQCMVTVGTGLVKACSWRGRKLLPAHCYPVIDVTESNDGPSLTVLDSWVNGDGDDGHLSQSRHLRMTWSDVLSTFDGLYLSWNPEMWPRNLKFHGMWKRRGQDERCSTSRLRLIVDNAIPNTSIWTLLTRHVVDSKRTSDFISLRVEPEDDTREVTGPIIQQILTEKGTFTNSIHVLAKVQVPESSSTLSIIASYDGDADEIGYTIDVYGVQGIDLAWDENIPRPPYTEKVTGSFTAKNSGGNGIYPTFMLNPQYYLRLHPLRTGSALVSVPAVSRTKVKTVIALKSGRHVPVNVSVAWSQGERIYVLSEKDLAATSGPYSYGLATITKDLAPGDYSIILSAFEPHHLGSFSLSISTASPFDLRPIPQEGAGMYQKMIRGEWTTESAGGSPSFDKYASNPVYVIESPCQLQVKLRLQLIHPSTTASLNVTFYPAPASSEPNYHIKQKHVATSGPYDDAICGVATPQVSLNPGKYWAVPSTYMPGVKAEFRLVVYTSVKDVLVERVT